MTSEPPDDKAARRSKLFGRVLLIGFGLLVLVYVVATFRPQ